MDVRSGAAFLGCATAAQIRSMALAGIIGGSAAVHGVDDLGVVDLVELHRGYAEVGAAKFALG